MARPDRTETRIIYGRSRVPRSHRRIMTALLAADGATAWELIQLAQVRVSTVRVFLVRMQTIGWVTVAREPVLGDRRARYRLTGPGKACVRRLLGLDPNPWPTVSGGQAPHSHTARCDNPGCRHNYERLDL